MQAKCLKHWFAYNKSSSVSATFLLLLSLLHAVELHRAKMAVIFSSRASAILSKTPRLSSCQVHSWQLGALLDDQDVAMLCIALPHAWETESSVQPWQGWALVQTIRSWGLCHCSEATLLLLGIGVGIWSRIVTKGSLLLSLSVSAAHPRRDGAARNTVYSLTSQSLEPSAECGMDFYYLWITQSTILTGGGRKQTDIKTF